MAFVEDAAPFLTDFGIVATVGGVSVRGIFDNAAADPFGVVAGTQPTLLIATADLGSAAVGTAAVIVGTTYSIAEIQPDGTGMTRLVLKT
jgi:hypothetical protein